MPVTKFNRHPLIKCLLERYAKMPDVGFLCVFIYIFTQNETSAITRISVRVISLMRSVTLNDEDYFAVYDFFVTTLPSKSRTSRFI